MKWPLTVLVLAASTAQGFDLPAGAQLTADRSAPREVYRAATGPYADGDIPFISVEGAVRQRAWAISGVQLTPLQLIDAVRVQLQAEGFEVIFDCAARMCGGFDFRFGIDVLPAPSMYVALGRYHFATFVMGSANDPDAVATVLASTTNAAAFVQVDQVRALGPETVVLEPSIGSADDIAAEDIVPVDGSLTLSDLDFAPGAFALGEGPFASLATLAGLLDQNPGLRVALVGHTDTIGDLQQNIEVSRARAQAARERLISRFGVAPNRVDAHGAGYLAPIATNATPEGRARNRRVTAVFLSP